MAIPFTRPDIDATSLLLKQVAREIMLPKFRALEASDIESKATVGYAEDVVTVVDTAAEGALTAGLRDIFPDARVLGEEGAHADPSRLQWIADDEPLWIVDPLDGTVNFSKGDDGFGIMVSFASRGQTVAGWIYLAARDDLFVAEDGNGAYRNGRPLRVPALQEGRALSGTFSSRFMPPDLRTHITDCTSGRYAQAVLSGAAAVEYTEIALGHKDFATYFRLLPWDHAAPALILTEAGGRVEHLDGSPYSLRSINQLTLVGSSADVTGRIRGWLT